MNQLGSWVEAHQAYVKQQGRSGLEVSLVPLV